jgi:hypothetical protein
MRSEDFDDDVSQRLRRLGADTYGIALPGAAAARQRAAQRSRWQIAGIVLAGVSCLGIGIGIDGANAAVPILP